MPCSGRARHPRGDSPLLLDVDEDTLEVEVVPVFDLPPVSDETLELLEVRRELSELSERSRLGTPMAVAELRAAGLTVRDVAQLPWDDAHAGVPDEKERVLARWAG